MAGTCGVAVAVPSKEHTVAEKRNLLDHACMGQRRWGGRRCSCAAGCGHGAATKEQPAGKCQCRAQRKHADFYFWNAHSGIFPQLLALDMISLNLLIQNVYYFLYVSTHSKREETVVKMLPPSAPRSLPQA